MKLWNYIQGNRKGKDAHRLEREALKDPFLSEALEGLDSVKGNHAKRIEVLQKQVAVASRPKLHPLTRWSIAASILLLVSFGGYFFLMERNIYQMHEALQIQEKPEIDEPYAMQKNATEVLIEEREKKQQEQQKQPEAKPDISPLVSEKEQLITEDYAVLAQADIVDRKSVV